MKKILFLLLWATAVQVSTAQKYPEHPATKEHNGKSKAILLHLLFGYHEPGGDLKDRFGSAFSAGLGAEFMTKNNLIVGLEGHYYYGTKVKEDPLTFLRTPEGDIIGSDRLLASVVLRQRGMYTGALVGKLFPITDKRSGVRFTLGAGWAWHKIRVQDDNTSVAQLSSDYIKGYDRLTGGIGIQQFIGWQHLGADKRSNWMAGLEFSQAFTNTLRDWDFMEQRKLDQRRTDLRFGVRVAWTLPFYVGDSKEIFY